MAKKTKQSRAETARSFLDSLDSALANVEDAKHFFGEVTKATPAIVYGHEEKLPGDLRARLVGSRAEVPKDALYPDGVKVTPAASEWVADMLHQVQVRVRQLRVDLVAVAKKLDGVE